MTRETPDCDEPSVDERVLSSLSAKLARLSRAAVPLAAYARDLHASSLRPDAVVSVPLALLRALADALPANSEVSSNGNG